MRRFPFPTEPAFAVFSALTEPADVQDFLNTIPMDQPTPTDSCRSPRETLRYGRTACFEGALLAASALWYHGRAPLLCDFETTPEDEPHVIALFREGRYWGAISKTNHSVLRFRDPVYASVRELVMSYFHEYILDTGKKTLRRFSKEPFSLLDFDDEWLITEEPVWGVHDDLAHAPHQHIAPRHISEHLRLAEPIEIQAGKIIQWG